MTDSKDDKPATLGIPQPAFSSRLTPPDEVYQLARIDETAPNEHIASHTYIVQFELSVAHMHFCTKIVI